MNSPIGIIYLAATDEALVYCGNARENGRKMEEWLKKHMPDCSLEEASNGILYQAKKQLEAYFKGESKILDLPLNLIGTDFRKKVWQALETIPYGQSRTYGQIASQIGNLKASRAVGQANNHNPISYFIP